MRRATAGDGYVLTGRGYLLPFGDAEPVGRFPRGVHIVDVALAGKPVPRAADDPYAEAAAAARGRP
jgi:hypothetical protein